MKRSKAYQKFESTIMRSLGLLNIYIDHKDEIEAKFKERDETVETDDLVRSCIVLSVAAMDSYFTDLFAEIFIPHLKKKKPSKQMVSILTDAGLDAAQALEMFSMDRPYRRIRTLINNHYDGFVTQNFKKIDELFLAYGFKNFSASIEKSLHRKTLLRSIEILVHRRHAIVHEGDLNSHNKLKKINLDETLKRMKNMALFVEKADERIMSKK